jgi:hypothetical protein
LPAVATPHVGLVSYDDAVAAGDIKRSDVLEAIKFRDDPDNAEFVRSLRFEEATKFRLVHGGRFYESKEIAGIAHGIATGQFWDRDDLSGGMRSGQGAGILRNLGFVIDDGPLFELEHLRVDRTHGKPAPYQYVVLLWAISRARSGSPRMVPFNDARDELAQILAPFAVAQTAPDPAMPWFALRNSSWWELQVPTTPSGLTDADVQSLNLVAGLSAALYERLRDDESFAGAAIDVIGRMIGEEPGYDELLDDLRLTPLAGEVRSAPAHHDDASANSGKADGSRALIVTWNPDVGKWADRGGYLDAIERTARGEPAEVVDWSTGSRKGGASRGDRVFLLRLGDQGRGIIASGTALGEIYQAPHFDPENHPGELVNNVDIEWECVLPVEDALTREELNQQLPASHNWSPQGSGVLIKGELADQLEELWSNHLVGIGRSGSPEVSDAIAAVESVSNPRRKFGRRFTAVENAAIEERAVLVTREHFENELGYETEDVGAYESYDVRASKGQEVVRVEVKGTTTDGAEVVLTRNEVKLHRADYPNNALAVVRNITLDRSGDQPIATGGELVLVMPWKIDEGGLIPIAYYYRTGI